MSARDDYPYWPAPDERRFSAEGAWHWSIAMDEIDRLRAQISHYQNWFGTECRCDEKDCPL